jgi:small redox-active disulfide protein 2
VKIIVYGTGCAKCKQAETVVREAVAATGVVAEVEHVTDVRTIVERGIMMTPAIAVDGVMKVGGRVPALAEVKSWLIA